MSHLLMRCAMQAEALTLPVVVSRLTNARKHWLALQISSLLGMGPEKVRPQAMPQCLAVLVFQPPETRHSCFICHEHGRSNM